MPLPDPDRSRVVLIGASRFTDTALADLPAVRNNLDGLAACLGDIGGCTVVADPGSPVALVDPIHDAAAVAEDTLLVYYAGHGLVHSRTLGLLLAVVGSAPGRTHTAVPYDHVRECLIDSPATRKVVILDCCYSGRALGGMADPTTAIANEAVVEGTYLLASAPPNKQALSPPGERFTAFTGALLTLLNEGVPHGPAVLHLDLIYRCVRDTLRRAARPEPQLRAGNSVGELALIRNHCYRSPPSPRRDVPMATPATWRARAVRKRIRERLEELVGEAGLANPYACPVCQITVTGPNLIQHFDKHSLTETLAMEPATLTLTKRPVLLGDRYELGGFMSGTVRVAADTHTQQTVVVKLLSGGDKPVRLEHPGIVRVLDILPSHIVLEYIDGRTTENALWWQHQMGAVEAAAIITSVCAALGHAHRHGVVHGDLRSRNVMLTRSGAVKILNFRDRGNVPSDLQAAGRLLVELLTGIPLASGAPVPAGIQPDLEKVVRTALHPDLAKRYQTAEDFMHALPQ